MTTLPDAKRKSRWSAQRAVEFVNSFTHLFNIVTSNDDRALTGLRLGVTRGGMRRQLGSLLAGICFAAFGCSSGGGNNATPDSGTPVDAGTDAGPHPDGGNTNPNVWTAQDLGTGRATAVNNAGQALVVDDANQASATTLVAANGARTPLGGFDGGTFTIGVALDSAGDVAGYAEGANGRTAVVYKNGAWQALTGLSGAWSAATSIDDSGKIAGVMGGRDGGLQAFLWSAGVQQALPTPDGGSAVYALGGSGVLAGIFEAPNGDTHPFLIKNGALIDLGVLSGGTDATAYAVNESGTVVGSSKASDHQRHAFTYTTQLGDLGVPAGFVATEARGIDRLGRIITNVTAANGMSHPQLDFPGGHPTPADLTPKDANGVLFAGAHASMMTSNGRIAGWGSPQAGGVHAIVWTPGGLQ
jgi:probable HAF family extracellular repeat protein